jgi:hypothetical protein
VCCVCALAFLQYVDKKGILWQLQIMDNLSEDVEEKQGMRGGKGREEALVSESYTGYTCDASEYTSLYTPLMLQVLYQCMLWMPCSLFLWSCTCFLVVAWHNSLAHASECDAGNRPYTIATDPNTPSVPTPPCCHCRPAVAATRR